MKKIKLIENRNKSNNRKQVFLTKDWICRIIMFILCFSILKNIYANSIMFFYNEIPLEYNLIRLNNNTFADILLLDKMSLGKIEVDTVKQEAIVSNYNLADDYNYQYIFKANKPYEYYENEKLMYVKPIYKINETPLCKNNRFYISFGDFMTAAHLSCCQDNLIKYGENIYNLFSENYNFNDIIKWYDMDFTKNNDQYRIVLQDELLDYKIIQHDNRFFIHIKLLEKFYHMQIVWDDKEKRIIMSKEVYPYPYKYFFDLKENKITIYRNGFYYGNYYGLTSMNFNGMVYLSLKDIYKFIENDYNILIDDHMLTVKITEKD